MPSLRHKTGIGLPPLRPVTCTSPAGITRRPTLPQTQQPSRVHHASNDQVKVLSREPVDRGWRAWSVLVGSTAFMIPTFGLMTTVGIFQVYWKDNQLPPWSNTDTYLGLYPSLGFYLFYFAAPLASCSTRSGPDGS
ncbi:hypothetical protein BDP81DRAFT_515124 [Colletotrichum phormii]|uniref:Uncharacterized protein n=1 Tax=Colletotrichum phormii TaxID=359342 RepID=A0AAJ0EHP3_9PEZI|nr:uncharacterized protein BDP81DRAFT_515124 [Colletotrichum phormii]KAK1639219.1 hypothetical protein BDP81DRAFT_515124 [Colletotrichum phormii]